MSAGARARPPKRERERGRGSASAEGASARDSSRACLGPSWHQTTLTVPERLGVTLRQVALFLPREDKQQLAEVSKAAKRLLAAPDVLEAFAAPSHSVGALGQPTPAQLKGTEPYSNALSVLCRALDNGRVRASIFRTLDAEILLYNAIHYCMRTDDRMVLTRLRAAGKDWEGLYVQTLMRHGVTFAAMPARRSAPGASAEAPLTQAECCIRDLLTASSSHGFPSGPRHRYRPFLACCLHYPEVVARVCDVLQSVGPGRELLPLAFPFHLRDDTLQWGIDGSLEAPDFFVQMRGENDDFSNLLAMRAPYRAAHLLLVRALYDFVYGRLLHTSVGMRVQTLPRGSHDVYPATIEYVTLAALPIRDLPALLAIVLDRAVGAGTSEDERQQLCLSRFLQACLFADTPPSSDLLAYFLALKPREWRSIVALRNWGGPFTIRLSHIEKGGALATFPHLERWADTLFQLITAWLLPEASAGTADFSLDAQAYLDGACRLWLSACVGLMLTDRFHYVSLDDVKTLEAYFKASSVSRRIDGLSKTWLEAVRFRAALQVDIHANTAYMLLCVLLRLHCMEHHYKARAFVENMLFSSSSPRKAGVLTKAMSLHQIDLVLASSRCTTARLSFFLEAFEFMGTLLPYELRWWVAICRNLPRAFATVSAASMEAFVQTMQDNLTGLLAECARQKVNPVLLCFGRPRVLFSLLLGPGGRGQSGQTLTETSWFAEGGIRWSPGLLVAACAAGARPTAAATLCARHIPHINADDVRQMLELTSVATTQSAHPLSRMPLELLRALVLHAMWAAPLAEAAAEGMVLEFVQACLGSPVQQERLQVFLQTSTASSAAASRGLGHILHPRVRTLLQKLHATAAVEHGSAVTAAAAAAATATVAETPDADCITLCQLLDLAGLVVSPTANQKHLLPRMERACTLPWRLADAGEQREARRRVMPKLLLGLVCLRTGPGNLTAQFASAYGKQKVVRECAGSVLGVLVDWFEDHEEEGAVWLQDAYVNRLWGVLKELCFSLWVQRHRLCVAPETWARVVLWVTGSPTPHAASHWRWALLETLCACWPIAARRALPQVAEVWLTKHCRAVEVLDAMRHPSTITYHHTEWVAGLRGMLRAQGFGGPRLERITQLVQGWGSTYYHDMLLDMFGMPPAYVAELRALALGQTNVVTFQQLAERFDFRDAEAEHLKRAKRLFTALQTLLGVRSELNGWDQGNWLQRVLEDLVDNLQTHYAYDTAVKDTIFEVLCLGYDVQAVLRAVGGGGEESRLLTDSLLTRCARWRLECMDGSAKGDPTVYMLRLFGTAERTAVSPLYSCAPTVRVRMPVVRSVLQSMQEQQDPFLTDNGLLDQEELDRLQELLLLQHNNLLHWLKQPIGWSWQAILLLVTWVLCNAGLRRAFETLGQLREGEVVWMHEDILGAADRQYRRTRRMDKELRALRAAAGQRLVVCREAAERARAALQHVQVRARRGLVSHSPEDRAAVYDAKEKVAAAAWEEERTTLALQQAQTEWARVAERIPEPVRSFTALRGAVEELGLLERDEEDSPPAPLVHAAYAWPCPAEERSHEFVVVLNQLNVAMGGNMWRGHRAEPMEEPAL